MNLMSTQRRGWTVTAAKEQPMTRTVQITIYCHGPEILARFWAEALGCIVPGPPGARLAEDEDPIAAWKEFVAGLSWTRHRLTPPTR